jgi:hypothetical protein
VTDHRTSTELAAALRALAASDSAAAPPPDLEARLLAEFSSGRARSTAPLQLAWIAAAATLVLGAAVLLNHSRPQPRTAQAAFIQVPYVVPPAPYERTEIVRQNIPVVALVAAGFEVHVADSAGAIPADVLIGQDGRALAIRLVTGSQSERSMDR